MKTKKLIPAAVLILAFTLNFSYAEQSKYYLFLTNLNYTSGNTIEFDIILKSITEDKEVIYYSAGQYFLEFNPQIANGGTLTYSIISSDLPELYKPVSASVTENLLRLACNIPQTENAPEISGKGLLIARMKLETSSGKIYKDQFNLKWTSSNSIFRSKLCVADGKTISEIIDSDIIFNGINSEESVISVSPEIPKEFTVAQNYPNPFNPVTNLEFGISETGFVSLKVYDISGKEVATLVNELKPAGRYSVKFDGSKFASGVYFYKMTSGNFSEIKKMFLIK